MYSTILQDFSEKEADIVYWGKFKDQDIIFYIRNIADALKNLDKNEFVLFRSWVLNILTRNMEDEDKRRVQDEIESYEEGEEMMHNLERLYYEFKEEGILKGKAEGMPLPSIAKVTGLNEDKIKKLKDSMN